MTPTPTKKQEGEEFEIKVMERELKKNNYNCMTMYKITDRTRTQRVN